MSVSIAFSEGLALVTVDNPPVNALSQQVRAGLLSAVAACDKNPDVRGVVLVCRGRTFIAGADVTEFGKPPLEPHLPAVVTAIEEAAKPWVAAIHGSALGGGLEVGMACRFRVALASAQAGLPEVRLGLLPGAGGTVRLPRLVGPELAARMITGGVPISAGAAREAGLFDEVYEDELLLRAQGFLKEALARPLPLPVLARPSVDAPSS
ncbi:MAG: enoyl-CoA hydratase/isomerase family protein, partial [Lautropia sp.]